MNTGGWVTMVLSVGSVTALFVWCIVKVLRQPATTNKIHGPMDIDTHDIEP